MAAIYQWVFDGVTYTIYTTTLYPLEAREALIFEIDISGASMETMPEDKLDMSLSCLAGTVSVQLLLAPEQNDKLDMSLSCLAGTLEVILLLAPEQNDKLDMVLSLLDATSESKLVTTYHPDQGLIMDIDLDSVNCSMTEA